MATEKRSLPTLSLSTSITTNDFLLVFLKSTLNMAPPTPVFSKSELITLHRFPLDPTTGEPNCPLKEITQFECGVYGTEIICVPFKRIFRACKGGNGQEQLIEVTTEKTNIPLRKHRISRDIGRLPSDLTGGSKSQ